MIGTTLSHYKIIEKLGAGGQGEVYLAEDSRLDRKVALKILPQHLSERAELRERFEREARAVSSLNHPHICTLYDIGEQDGIHYLVMEHLVGETLEARLSKGALPLEQTLEYAIQIADALDKAHRQGVVHRDLKPGNIMLVKSGAKLLDFGLAKIQAAETPTNLSALPTEQANLTAEGTILGTLQYMAPEQLEGKEADSRTDIFAFGAVVYEMATGKKAFEGKSQASLIAAIMGQEPRPMSELQPMTPQLLDWVVKRCLSKEPDERWQAASDVMAGLRQVTEVGPPQDFLTSAASTEGWKRMVPWGLASLTTIALLFSLIVLWPSPPVENLSIRLQVQLPSDQSLNTGARAVILSPDGKRLVYVAGSGQNSHLYVRALDQLEAAPLSGTDGAQYPFFSPDGEWVAFFLGPGGQRTLKKVAVGGGAPVTISQEPHPGYSGSWGADGTIIIGNQVGVLSGLSDSGGSPEPLTTLKEGELAHVFPQILPGGEAVLFTAQVGASWNDAQIVVQMLGTGERKVLINGGTDARYVLTGHLVYSREETLLAVAFDLGRLEVTGSPVPIVEGVMAADVRTGAAQFSFSDSGLLVYVRGTAGEQRQILVWVDREGYEEPLTAPSHRYSGPSLSPDAQRVAVSFRESGNFDSWIYDLARGTMTRLTFDAAPDFVALWTPDGQRVVFSSTRDGGFENLYWRAADGTGQVERLTTSPTSQTPYSFSPDGKQLVFTERHPPTGLDLYVLSMEGEFTAEPLLQTPFHERDAAISPDGRWMAYRSNESGSWQVYVRPFPNVEDGRWQVSTGGGISPVWGRQGRELFYRNGEAMMVVSLETEPTFSPGSPKVLFTGRYAISSVRNYDISLDGQSFLMIKDVEQAEETSARTELIMVLNWFEELKRLVPTDD